MRGGWNRFTEWRREHPDFVFALGVVVFLRIWFGVLGALSLIANVPELTPNIAAQYHSLAPAPTQGLWLLLTPWQRWDAIWYWRIAEFGYAPNDLSPSFFPLFPILIRAVEIFVGKNALLAGLIVCTLATFGAFVLIYRLSAEMFDDAAARRAVLFCAVFPTAFYLFGGYAESVLFFCSVAALYCARRKRWGWAGLASAGATLARPIGFLIALPLLIEAWRAGNLMRERARAALSLLGVIIAMGAWMIYLQMMFGDVLLWVHAEDGWQRVFVIPGQTIVWTMQNIFGGQVQLANNIVDLLLTSVVAILILVTLKKFPLSFSLYALAMIAVPLTSFAQAEAYRAMPMAAAARRALVAFPAFIALGAIWRGKWKEPLWILFSLTLQGILFVAFTQWYWVD